MQSILNSVKPQCGLTTEQTAFDTTLLIHINSTLSDLHLLGIGPQNGFQVTDENDNWEEFIGSDDPRFSNIVSYVGLRVRLLFDPPANATILAAIERQIAKYEFLLNIAGETYEPPVED